jgi:tRNA(fMet)-specific endonuclease VapC
VKYLLDSNTCIEHFRRGARSPVTPRILSLNSSEIALCTVVRGELMCGALKSRDPGRSVSQLQRFLAGFASLPLDDAASDKYGEIRAHLERTGQSIGPNDMFIAAIALVHQLVLVTNNLREFTRVPNLTCEDWTIP